MSDDNSSILAEFEAFMAAKQQKAAEDAQADDEVEIWDEKGRGARVKRSVAKPFLQSLGIDVDQILSNDDPEHDKSDGVKNRPTGKTAANSAVTGSTVRKYFTKPAKP